MDSNNSAQIEPKVDTNYNKTNLEILLGENDIVKLLKKINKESKVKNKQISLSEFVKKNNVSHKEF